ncbi:hypothetical protein PENTCL1PPCAC_7335 [Pristionchus entomophagus]|uniref:SXP/RAL-2 family protein Ani s 5-like cation-binding domain-containing protein n=1 Tax=Pristionchus entomophagus TaxID=358040 RepID=A0AAV5SQ80_9BILA|nr:hypothetical protein PENTCL1PPCAC_7335 [Pristionchus entomophagus]
MQTTVLLLASIIATTLGQWSPYGFQQPRPIMPQFGGRFGGGGPFGGMPSPFQGESSIRFAPQRPFGENGGFGGHFGDAGGQFGANNGPFGSSGGQFGTNGGQFGGMMNSGGQFGGMGGMGGSSFPPYVQQQSSQLVLPPGALSAPGFSSGGQGNGMGSPFSSSIDNSITSMNSLNNVPRFGQPQGPGQGFPGSGQGGFPGSGGSGQGGFPGSGGSDGSSGVRRVIPPFLQGADKETEDRFYAIVQNPTWSAAEKEQRVQEFIATLDSSKQNTYEQFRREAASTQKTKRDKVHDLVEQMTPEAQQQFQKVSALMTNPGISDQERLKQISDLYNKLTPQIRSEFDAKFTGL